MEKKSSKKLKKADLGVAVLLVLGIVAVINFFSYQIFQRLDLTQGKIYSISSVSKKTVANLDDIVTVKAYFSSSLPSQVLNLKQEVGDILAEYAAYSNGKVKVEFIDPGDDQATQQELQMIGIPQLTFEVYEKDKSQLVKGYMGIAFSYGSKTEVIPAIKQDTSDLEYQITSAIKKATSQKIVTVGILSDHGVATMDKELTTVSKELESIYSLQPVTLAEDKPAIDKSINTLIIVGPKTAFNDAQQKAINDFVANGGALFVMLDGVKIEQGLAASKNSTGLDALLEKYGIKVNQNLVADLQSGTASFSQGFFSFSTPYPFWPKIMSDGFDKNNSAVSSLTNVVLPWPSSVSVDETKISKDAYSYLIHTTDKAWTEEDNFNIAPNGPGVNPTGTQKIYNLAVFVNGQINNAYPKKGAEKIKGKIIVLGDSQYATDSFLQNNPDNLHLFQNLVDILSLDEDLINIRSKGVSSRPIKELSDSDKALIRYLNVFGVTIIVIAFGMTRYYLRRRSRFVDDL